MKKNKIIIIAEVGVNHNGNIKVAKKLIDIAKRSGADYVKFQTFKPENLVRKNTKITQYQSKNLRKKISFMSSPFDLESLNLLFRLKIFDIKVASGEINNYIFLKKIAKKAKKIAEKTEEMMGTIFTTIGIQKGSQAVSATQTKEGVKIKVENLEYEARIGGVEQATESNQEKLDDVDELRNEIDELKQFKAQQLRDQKNKRNCVVS